MNVKSIKGFNSTIFVILGIVVILLFVFIYTSHAAYWTALPPYNTLWPLWSPVLSPLTGPGAGVPTPIVSSLDPTTVLPVQPGLTWDPSWTYPWLLYNTPTGLGYFDQRYGFNAWPPSYLVGAPLILKGPWANLAPTLIDWGQVYLPLANLTYALLYDLNPVDFSSLLTAGAIWGL